jgi:hypothetical protein
LICAVAKAARVVDAVVDIDATLSIAGEPIRAISAHEALTGRGHICTLNAIEARIILAPIDVNTLPHCIKCVASCTGAIVASD